MELDLLTGLIPVSRSCSNVRTWPKSSLLLWSQRATGSTPTLPLTTRGSQRHWRVRLRGWTGPPRGLCVIHGRCCAPRGVGVDEAEYAL
jgi:hypothetical protein